MTDNYNGRIALSLFWLYLFLYGGFMGINVFSPDLMDWTPFAGVNLAIWYGFGLIGAAILLALAYGMLCRPEAPSSENSSQEESK